MQDAEVVGVVTKIDFPTPPSKVLRFKVHCPNAGKTFQAATELFCPIRVGDTIFTRCKVEKDNLYVLSQPFVQPSIDKENIIVCFMKAIKIVFSKAAELYRFLQRKGDPVTYLSEISQKYADYGNPDILSDIPGLEPEICKKLLNWWHKERNLRRLYLFGLNKKEINNSRLSCDEIYNKCLTNPFTVPAIPMEKCDDIMSIFNKRAEPAEKERGQIIRIVWNNTNMGWTGTPTYFIIRQFPNVGEHMEKLKSEYGLEVDLSTAYLSFPYKVENFLATYFRKPRESSESEAFFKYDPNSERYKHLLSDDQKLAVQGALDKPISIITGAAGTGKTSIIVHIVNNLEIREIPYFLCSFTGKAVHRLREVTGRRSPATMHRLIQRSKKELDEVQHVIIDEASMVTGELMYDFICAFPSIKKITLIGDINQLPPIGWGSVFKELIISKTIPIFYLRTNFRVYTANGERDGIIMNANNIILHDEEEPFEFFETSNFSVVEGGLERVYDIIKVCHESGIKAENLIVISPYNRTLEEINKRYKEIFDQGERSIMDSRGKNWKINDQVMLIKNDDEINVFNGEIGRVCDINDRCILVDFKESGIHDFVVEPKIKENYYEQPSVRGDVLDGYENVFTDDRSVLDLVHAYALTVDKSQGSEWDFVIFYIGQFDGNSFLNKNRIYTAITRTKRCCWCVVSDINSFQNCAVKKLPFRCENLHKRLCM